MELFGALILACPGHVGMPTLTQSWTQQVTKEAGQTTLDLKQRPEKGHALGAK